MCELSLAALAAWAYLASTPADVMLLAGAILGGALFVAFAWYLAAVRARLGDGIADCGCGIGELPVGSEAVNRALALGGLSVIGFGVALASPPAGLDRGALANTLLLASGLSTACLVVWFPVAMYTKQRLAQAVAT